MKKGREREREREEEEGNRDVIVAAAVAQNGGEDRSKCEQNITGCCGCESDTIRSPTCAAFLTQHLPSGF